MQPTCQSTPDIADVCWYRGVDCDPNEAVNLLIEVPHGATATRDYDSVAALLKSPLPDGLVDFFHVNTDAGAFELADATARYMIETRPQSAVQIIRSRIPRTFIDCNRRIDEPPEAFRAGKVTPGLMPWVSDPADIVLLRKRHADYVAIVRNAIQALPDDAGVLLLHSYAPRSVGVEVDLDIVTQLRRAYQPPLVNSWPLRPEIDVISRDTEGRCHAPVSVVKRLRERVAELGWQMGDSTTYPLHPSTLAWEHNAQCPGRTLCLEVRRDLLADPFEPFAQMQICPKKVARIAKPLAEALEYLHHTAQPEP